MSGFDDNWFPEAIARGGTEGPGYDTTIVTTGAGFERRDANWQQARGRWDVGSGIKRRADFTALVDFFRARQGRAYGFRFKDWPDFEAVGVVFGTGDSVQTTFQLVKRYASGGVDVVRTITRLVAGTIEIYRDGARVSSGVTVETATGFVTLAKARHHITSAAH